MARLRCAVSLARPLRRAPPNCAPKGLHEKCPAAALRSSSNRTSVRPSSRALHLSTFRANAAPSGFCISLLGYGRRHLKVRQLALITARLPDPKNTILGADLGSDPQTAAKLKEAQRQFLGEARFAQFERAADDDFKSLFELGRENHLPREAAGKLDRKSVV